MKNLRWLRRHAPVLLSCAGMLAAACSSDDSGGAPDANGDVSVGTDGGPGADAGADATTDGGGETDGDATVSTGDGGPTTLMGAAAKGPFILGTGITVSPVDGKGNTTGQSFSSQISDDVGDFSVVFTYLGPVQLSANGYYYNEIGGSLSQSTLTLNGMAAITSSGTQNAYVNLLSHLEFLRIKFLMNGGATFDAAVAQADGELYTQLQVVSGSGFNVGATTTELNLLGGDNAQAAYVFATASAVEQAANLSTLSGGLDAKVQTMVNQLQNDFQTTGTFTTADHTALQNAVACVEPDSLEASLGKYFTQKNSTAVVPNINRALDTDGDGVVNAQDTCVLIANSNQATIPNGICNYQSVSVATPTVSGSCIQSMTPGIVADVDGTSGPDMLSIDCTDLFLWKNAGGGTFAAPVPLNLATTLGVTINQNTTLGVGWMYAVDMNADSKLDLVLQYTVSNQGNGKTYVAYLPGDGSGGFSSPVAIVTPCTLGGGGTSCTQNGDCCSNSCMIFPSNGTCGGTVSCGVGGASCTQNSDCCNNAPCMNNKCMSNCQNTNAGCSQNSDCCSGTCNLPPPTGTCDFPTNAFSGLQYAEVADLNGDNVPDVAGVDSMSKVWTILSGGGSWAAPALVGTLPQAATGATALAGGSPRTGGGADFSIATHAGGIFFVQNGGTGTFTIPTSGWTGLGTEVDSFSLANLDVDGHVDVIGASSGALKIAWGDGTTAPSGTPYTVNTTATSACQTAGGGCFGNCPVPLGIGDVTGDGKPDLYAGDALQIEVNNGDRTFAAPKLLWTGASGGTAQTGAGNPNTLVDLNGDGKADLVNLNGLTAPTVFLLNQTGHFSW